MTDTEATTSGRAGWPRASVSSGLEIGSGMRVAEPARAPNEASGLSSGEAEARLRQFGPNSTPDERSNPLRRLLAKFIAPVPCLLEAAIVLQLFLHEYVEAGVIGLLLIFNAALGFFHEQRAQNTIEALKSRLAIQTSARRDGSWMDIAASELVPGDVVKLSLGTVVPADVKLLGGNVSLDHSMLTGESLPVEGGAGLESYAGALVCRGEAIAVVAATGTRTRFGRTAELVRTAHVVSTQQKAIFKVVTNLAMVNGAVALALIAYSYWSGLPAAEFIPLALIVLLATVPVALPATFTLSTAIGARALTRRGVLPTRLSAVDEAASMDVLCSDKTGTLTENKLELSKVEAFAGCTSDRVIALAAMASAEGSQDQVDRAVRAAAKDAALGKIIDFTPFDPATKTAEARVLENGQELRVVKGAFSVVSQLSEPDPVGPRKAEELERAGYRVLGVACGTREPLQLVGLLALSDPPRLDAAPLIADLKALGVEVVMVTGDAPATAETIASKVGIVGRVHTPADMDGSISSENLGVFAGVLPEDKFKIVKTLQASGHTVGMCGDGANDAPALRQAQIGIAVSTATDVAKSAAGIVLTEPGLAGVVAAVREGRITFQRILTYTLRSIINKVRQVLFLSLGFVITGHAVLTPMLMVLMMVVGDFLAMSSSTDNVRPSPQPNTWRINTLTLAGTLLGLCDLIFCGIVLAFGAYVLDLPIEKLQTLTLVTLVFNGQAVFYVSRERRRLWSSMPSRMVILSSIVDVVVIPTMAAAGVLMSPLPTTVILGTFAAAVVLAFVLDFIKSAIFVRLRMA